MPKTLIALLCAVPLLTGCGFFGLDGCTDRLAMNYDARAADNDGSCEYSRVVFYTSIAGPPANMAIDGVPVGTITAFAPGGPANCASPGFVQVQLTDGEEHEWTADDGTTVDRGFISAARGVPCIRVSVF